MLTEPLSHVVVTSRTLFAAWAPTASAMRSAARHILARPGNKETPCYHGNFYHLQVIDCDLTVNNEADEDVALTKGVNAVSIREHVLNTIDTFVRLFQPIEVHCWTKTKGSPTRMIFRCEPFNVINLLYLCFSKY